MIVIFEALLVYNKYLDWNWIFCTVIIKCIILLLDIFHHFDLIKKNMF